uniref:AAA+ ATPase domain-containing protein n=1 Tax=viral metagenome TaxID=1070528 RepID=A0A6C0BF80_9ZZZZ
MYKVRKSDDSSIFINCARLNNPIAEHIEISNGNKNVFLKTFYDETVEKDFVYVSIFVMEFLDLKFDQNVTISPTYNLIMDKQHLYINAAIIGSLIPSPQEISDDFKNLKEDFHLIPICDGLRYYHAGKYLYSFVCTNISDFYTFVGNHISIFIKTDFEYPYEYIIDKTKQNIYSKDLIEDTLSKVSSLKDNMSKLKDDISSLNNRFKTKEIETDNSPVFHDETKTTSNDTIDDELFSSDFNFDDLQIGGLDEQIKTIFRVAFSSRILSKESKNMGIKPPKGILLYGPPGTGKTLIAKKISKALKAKSFQVVNGPELLNKYIGETAHSIRNLFKKAEDDMKTKQNGLHIIVFDEFDAIARIRSSGESSTGSGSETVNQLLTKIDGLDELNNILIIATTNMKSSIDPALLRSGRIDLHIKIDIPNREGRKRIFEIHTEKLLRFNNLHHDVNIEELANITNNFSGAEIKSVIDKAATYQLAKLIDPKTMRRLPLDSIVIKMDDFIMAIKETNPVMGSVNKEIELITSVEIDLSNEEFRNVYNNVLESIASYFEGGILKSRCRNFTVLISGPTFSGKTKLVAHAIKYIMNNFSHIKFITPEKVMNEKCNIWNLFQEGINSESFLFVIDSIETIFDYSTTGVIQSKTRELLTILNSNIDISKKVVTILTCSNDIMINKLDLDKKVTLHLKL